MILHIQQLLLLQVIYHLKTGNESIAASLLNGSFKLNQSLKNRPEPEYQSIYFSTLTKQALLLRRFNSPPQDWKLLFVPYDAYSAHLISEAYFSDWFSLIPSLVVKDCLTNTGVHSDTSVRLEMHLKKPIVRYKVSDILHKKNQLISQLRRTPRCSMGSENPDLKNKYHVARWNSFGRDLEAGLGSHIARESWWFLDREMVQFELNRNIMLAREARDSSPDLLWPVHLGGIESTVCPNGVWSYSATTDRKKMHLQLRGKPEQTPLAVPVDYSEVAQ